MDTIKYTVSQALIQYLNNQYLDVDGESSIFFAGYWGIFGHGNLAGIGQAINEYSKLPFYIPRNEQAMVHSSIAYSKVKRRRQSMICTSSIGPGAMNMITGALTATINRIPVLLLPGDIFSKREPDPVLQQIEYSYSRDYSCNDAFKIVSKYWDRINRPEQLIYALPEVMRVLTSPSETGCVTLCMPQDTQVESFDFPKQMFEKRVWYIPRPKPDTYLFDKAIQKIKKSKRPLIIAGGGVKYSYAEQILNQLAKQTGIPIGETFAGKGVVDYKEKYSLGGLGATGTKAAIHFANKADLVIGIGTRYSDFTTASNSLFKNEDLEFININISEIDIHKKGALPILGDAKVVLEEISKKLEGWEVEESYSQEVVTHHSSWQQELKNTYQKSKGHKPMHQASVIDIINSFMQKTDIMVAAAGSLPGDLHKLWQSGDVHNFHLEYGNSCMGYEIAGGLGIKMAYPNKDVYVLLGDGSYLMLNHEIITSIQEGYKLTIILFNNNGYASIGALSESIGSNRFGTKYGFKSNGSYTEEKLPVDLLKNAESLGAISYSANNETELKNALEKSKANKLTTVIVVEVDLTRQVGGYNAWWDVPVAEISRQKSVQEARSKYNLNKKQQRYLF